MTPAPLAPGGALALSSAASQLAERLAEPPRVTDDWRRQSLSKGAVGVAVLHGSLARASHGSLRRAHAWLSYAVNGGITDGVGTGLWFGAPAVAFAIGASAPDHYHKASSTLKPVISDTISARLRAADARMTAATRPSVEEYDVVRGLAGLGAYLLDLEPEHGLLEQVLRYLVRLTEPLAADDAAGPDAPGWWSSSNPNATVNTPGGHGNFGMAHGITGPLALLALTARLRITVSGQANAIDRICEWLDAWCQAGPAGPWWPTWITVDELHAGHPSHPGPGRPSWCYGTPGITRALQLAALARHDKVRQAAAENALVQCVTDPAQVADLTGPGLCHGWAGTTAATWHAARDADSTSLDAAAGRLAATLVSSADGDHPYGLIDGYAGAALTLHDLATQEPGIWPRCLLLA